MLFIIYSNYMFHCFKLHLQGFCNGMISVICPIGKPALRNATTEFMSAMRLAVATQSYVETLRMTRSENIRDVLVV